MISENKVPVTHDDDRHVADGEPRVWGDGRRWGDNGRTWRGADEARPAAPSSEKGKE